MIRKKSRLKIAIFHLAFIYSGGGEKLVLEQARGLKKRGHQVATFTSVLDRKNCFPDVISEFPIRTFLPKLPSFIPEWQSFQILLSCVLIPIIAQHFKDFDVILAANQPSPWLAWVIKRMYKVPYIAYLAQPTRFLHPRKIDREVGLRFVRKGAFSPATFLMELAKPLVNWADQVSIKGADLVLANGEYVKGLLEKTYGIKVVSCPAGAYPAERIKNYEERIMGQIEVGGIIVKKPYILLTNRHFPQKRFEYAISALPAILKEHPEVSLVITGSETEYTKGLKVLVRQLSLEEKVLFLGFVGEKDLKKLYANAAVYVYTAPEEDFGMGMVEAMAHGTPVVAWDSAGPTGIVVDGKTGLLAKPYDVADFADKIRRLLSEVEFAKEIGRVGWREVKENLSYKRHTLTLAKYLTSTL